MQEQEPQQQRPKPVLEKTFQIGLVSCSVWSRIVEVGPHRVPVKRHSVHFSRGYRDRDGKWQSNGYFDHHDLVVVARLAELSLHYLATVEDTHSVGSANESEDEVPF